MTGKPHAAGGDRTRIVAVCRPGADRARYRDLIDRWADGLAVSWVTDLRAAAEMGPDIVPFLRN
jgi:hypothetical protein